jgi:hypothetical protein
MMLARAESSVPNIFYDLIVFITPSVLLLLGLAVGLYGWPLPIKSEAISKIGTVNLFLLILCVLFAGYEYGRLAETLSSPFVAEPLKYLSRKKIIFGNPDFNADLTAEVQRLDLPSELGPGRMGSKWTIYFFASLVAPPLGRDLLKRYAWEKLSRSSAFTFLVLFFFSLVLLLLNVCGLDVISTKSWSFSSVKYTIISFIMCVLTFYEYYRRNSWNNDLLSKVLPVLLLAQKDKLSDLRSDSIQDIVKGVNMLNKE